jgi:hypothetical protein
LNSFLHPFLPLYSFHDHFYSPLSTFYALKPLSYHFFGYIFHDVVETSHNLAVDAAGVAGHLAPKSADAAITAPELAPVDAGEVEEMQPQVVADGPSQLIRDVCNCICATKTTSRANSGVAEKHTTTACARRAVLLRGDKLGRKRKSLGRNFTPRVIKYYPCSQETSLPIQVQGKTLVTD